ncbi:MAG TPA: hypothetical protein DEH27_06385 [Deltaproteobacteria bacterium]|nr:hypothetical protein [Deltaproteobacteria bacterium]
MRCGLEDLPCEDGGIGLADGDKVDLTTNLYSHSVSDAKEIVGRRDIIGKSANPCKREETSDGTIQKMEVFFSPFRSFPL